MEGGESVGGRGGRRVRWSVVVVQGCGQVAYVVEWRAADRAILLRAGRSSGAGSGSLLVRILSFVTGIGIGIGIGIGRIHTEFISVDLV